MYNDFHVSSTNQKPTNQKPKNGSNERVKLWFKNPLWSPILILNLFHGLKYKYDLNLPSLSLLSDRWRGHGRCGRGQYESYCMIVH